MLPGQQLYFVMNSETKLREERPSQEPITKKWEPLATISATDLLF